MYHISDLVDRRFHRLLSKGQPKFQQLLPSSSQTSGDNNQPINDQQIHDSFDSSSIMVSANRIYCVTSTLQTFSLNLKNPHLSS